ncbi:MAG: hypothetical protein A2113_04270, partial [Candidatus Woykebacteria bacterium GWA1_44_8]
TGILQHTKYGIPHRSFGYSLDDNARALLAMVQAYKLFKKKEYLSLARIYLSFIIHAKEEGGFFRNFQTFDHRFLPHVSQDSFGETMWALAETFRNKIEPALSNTAWELFSESEKTITKIKSPRAVAYLIIALYHALKSDPGNISFRQRLVKLTKFLLGLYEKNQDGSWNWFESVLTYANHILPAALFYSYRVLGEKKILEVAKRSLAFLEKETHADEGIPSPIGSYGWYTKGGEKAGFDQQPVEAAYAVIANVAAAQATKNKRYYRSALEWFAWFHGNNIKKVNLYDKKTGGCFDGIGKFGPNLNQGAESVACYLLAYLELANLASKKKH